MKNKKLNIIDLFSGCGGLTDGFEKTNKYNLLAAVEWDKACCNTLIKRLESKYKINKNKVINFDIQLTNELINGWDSHKYSKNIGLDKIINHQNVDIIIGGPPCQAYSLAGRIRDKNGMHNDYRNFLFEKYVLLVKKYKPSVFVFENVVGILSAKPGGVSIIDRIENEFKKIGYFISPNLRHKAVFNVADFGVPQNRKRIIIFGVNKNKFKNHKELVDNFYKLVNKKKCKKKMTVLEAIGNLNDPQKENNQNITWHKARKHSQRDKEIFRMLANDLKSGERKYIDIEKLKKLYTKLTGKTSNVHKYYVLRENEPSNTIPAHLHKDGLRHIHPDPDQARSITVREAARLQSFDDDYNFIGSQTDAYKMIGNAVPPKFAKIIALVISKIL